MSETVKLIIEIPKEDIELICKTSFVEDERTMFKQSPSDRQGTMMLHRLMDSVKDGIPLPKGHGRLIDADDLLLYTNVTECGYKPKVSRYQIITAPTIVEADKAESEDKAE